MSEQVNNQNLVANISVTWRENAINAPGQNVNNFTELPFIEGFESVPLWQVKIVFSIIYGSGIIANSILLIYLLYYKRYKSPVFCVILSLCVSDLGVCIAGMMWLSVFPIMYVGLPPWMCNVTQTLLNVSFLSSSYHMVVFAALRFYQLIFPLASRAKVTVSLLARICLSIWTAGLIQAFVITSFFETTEIEYNKQTRYTCNFWKHLTFFFIWIAATWFMLPFLTTSGFHFAKHVILVCKRSFIMTTPSLDQKSHTQTDSRALTRVITLYLVSILPSIVQNARYMFTSTFTNTDLILFSVFENIAFMNSSCNPWIYMLSAESVRADIRNMCVHRNTNRRASHMHK